jgi:hypothetical protein
MRKIYNSINLISAAFLLIILLSACSENDDDISAPTVTSTYPAENDTIQLVLNSITVSFAAKDDVKIDKMSMNITSQSESFPYSIQFAEDAIDNQYFNCVECFPLYGLTKTTPMKWTFYLQNEFHSWKKKEIDFYVRP